MTQLRVNSAPFAFRSFSGEQPTTEELRAELERSHQYLQDSLKRLQFANLSGYVTSNQAPFVSEQLSSVITGYTTADEALANRISVVEATINDPRTGLARAHARISLEQSARATLLTAMATQTSIVYASVGNAYASITEERTARITADGTITANLSLEVTARRDGDDDLAAAVSLEADARSEADGFLSGKYTIKVTAGNVVTGMNITSSTGAGSDVSDITFQASSFKIYNGSTGITMFNVTGSDVTLSNTLVVSTSGRVYIGTGVFNATNTPFYVDASGQFSLKDKLSWNGTTLSINGNLTSTSGTIAGFTLSSTGLDVGSGSTYFLLQSSSGTIQFGAGTNRIGVINSSGYAGTNSGGIGTLGWFLGFSSSDNRLSIYDTSSVLKVSIVGSTGSVTCDRVSANTGVHLLLNAGGTDNWSISTTGNLVNRNNYNITKLTSDGWTTKLSDGSATIEFQASGSNIYGRINGGAPVLLG